MSRSICAPASAHEHPAAATGTSGVGLLLMSTAGRPEGSAPKLTLPHGDPGRRGVELGHPSWRLGRARAPRRWATAARDGSHDRPQRPRGRLAHPLHAAADLPGYFPAAPAAVVLLLDAGADPTTTLAAVAPKRRCTGRLAAMTSVWQSRFSTAAPSSKHRVGRSAPSSTRRSATPAGTLPGCWVARGARVNKLWHAAALGMVERIE